MFGTCLQEKNVMTARQMTRRILRTELSLMVDGSWLTPAKMEPAGKIAAMDVSLGWSSLSQCRRQQFIPYF